MQQEQIILACQSIPVSWDKSSGPEYASHARVLWDSRSNFQWRTWYRRIQFPWKSGACIVKRYHSFREPGDEANIQSNDNLPYLIILGLFLYGFGYESHLFLQSFAKALKQQSAEMPAQGEHILLALCWPTLEVIWCWGGGKCILFTIAIKN